MEKMNNILKSYYFRLTILTIVYFIVFKLGGLLTFSHTTLYPIWIPTGIGLAIAVLLGYQFLPAIFIAVFIAEIVAGLKIPLSFLLAAVNTLEAFIGSWLLLRVGNFNYNLVRLKDVGSIILYSSIISTSISATLGTLSFCLLTPVPWNNFGSMYLPWWMGNVLGSVIVAPLIFILASSTLKKIPFRRIVEFGIAIIGTLITSNFIFNGAKFNYSFAYIIFPLTIWISVRFKQQGAVCSTIVVTSSAIYSVLSGNSLFLGRSNLESLLFLDGFLIIQAVIVLTLAAITTERNSIISQLQTSEEVYRLIAERTGQLVYDYNVETGSIQWSGAVFDVTQFTPEEFSIVDIRAWAAMIHPDDREKTEAALNEAMRRHREFYFEYRFQRKDGIYFDVLDRGVFLYRNLNDTSAYRMLGTMADISSLKYTVKKLRESEERYKLFSMLTSDYIYAAVRTDSGLRTEWASEAFERITGYSLEEINENGGWLNLIHPDDTVKVVAEANKTSNGEPIIVEYRITTKKGETKWLRDYIKPIIDAHTSRVTRFMGGVQDITERKRVEERFRILIEKSADGIILLDKRGRISFVSVSATAIIGYSSEELLQRSIFEILHPSEAKKYAFKFGRLSVEFERSEYLLGRFKHKNGQWVHIEGMVTNLLNNSSVNAFVANFRNVTDRVHAEDRLRRSLQEKEILLKEVHHRVKNNMQVISSLLNLQSASLKDKTVLAMVRESQNRVKSMALVHEILYQSHDIASMNFSDYAIQLIASLQKSFGAKAGEIKIVTKTANLSLDLDEAIPCGLIINELVSNALKYAFPKKRSGEIIVELKKKKSSLLLLSVRDNGIGLPKRAMETKTLGLKLVRALTEQMGGTISIQSKRGTAITVEFPEKKPTIS